MIKKLFGVAAATGLILSLAGSTPAHDEKEVPQPGEKVEKTIPVDPEATVTLCVASGALTVRGWDKHEVRVRSLDAQRIEFRRIDKPKDPSTPASRIDVMVFDKSARPNPKMDCPAIADVEMEVPAGATVQVQTRDGDIRIAGVAGAYAGSQNGDITIERATKLVEAGSIGGSISLRDSSGRINLSSAGGGVEAMNVKALSFDDTFEVGTVSGDIELNRIANPKVMVKTINGNLTMSGALVKSGHYALTNMTGDVLLELPHDASFRLSAKVSEKQKLVSEFPLTYIGEMTPAPPGAKGVPAPPTQKTPQPPPAKKEPLAPMKEKEKEKAPSKTGPVARTGPLVAPIIVERPTVAPYVRRIDAICGSGDAMISIASFGGTVSLKKL